MNIYNENLILGSISKFDFFLNNFKYFTIKNSIILVNLITFTKLILYLKLFWHPIDNLIRIWLQVTLIVSITTKYSLNTKLTNSYRYQNHNWTSKNNRPTDNIKKHYIRIDRGSKTRRVTLICRLPIPIILPKDLHRRSSTSSGWNLDVINTSQV